MSCLHNHQPFPNVISELSNAVKFIMLHDELLATEIAEIIIRLVNFQAAATSVEGLGPHTSLLFLRQAQADLTRWVSTLPQSWKYKTESCIPGDISYTAFHHLYPGFSIASSWNQYRIAQCLVNCHLITHLQSHTTEDQHSLGQYQMVQEARQIIHQMCNDICASVPYFLGRADKGNLQRPGVGALEIMWALKVCASMNCIPEEQRFWAISQLEKIGYEMGVLQAFNLASLAKSMIRDSGVA